MPILYFEGFIRDISYKPVLIPKINTYSSSSFNINQSKPFGIITLDSVQNNIAFSQWKSPKRTRTYPFARIYNTYHLNSKKVTIIPIIKDEGLKGDNDRINFITLSWMNLLNVYIILAWYEQAEVVPGTTNKITKQKFNSNYINQKIEELSNYQLTALHWNTTHFEKEFDFVYLNAVDSYEKIANIHQVSLHSRVKHIEVLNKFQTNEVFNLEKFKDYTLNRSLVATARESLTTHKLEYLADGYKGIFFISNYLGGVYHLTVDEVYIQGDVFVLQESKNSIQGQLPSEDDIKDGLFKLILFGNLECLRLEREAIEFTTCLKLTGKIKGFLHLPSDRDTIELFCQTNKLNKRKKQIIQSLDAETKQNFKLKVLITSNEQLN